MEIIPAIDLRGGRVVRLFQGKPEEETVYHDDASVVASNIQRSEERRVGKEGRSRGWPYQ